MKGLSNHTKLMNAILYLAHKNRSCEPVLYKNHYTVDSIELSFNKQNGDKIHTDMTLINPKLQNFVLIECKDGRLQKDQADRYNTLNFSDIVNAGVAPLTGKFNYEVVYVSSEDKKDKLLQDIRNNSYSFPVLVFNDSKIKLEHNTFKCQTLNQIFTENEGADIPNPFPVFFYPFGKDDSDAYILSWIGRTLIKFIGQEFDVEDVLRETHQIYEFIDEKALKDLKGRIAKLLTDISKKDMNEFFVVPSNKHYRLKVFGVSKFQRLLNKCVSNADKEVPKDKQLKLVDYPK